MHQADRSADGLVGSKSVAKIGMAHCNDDTSETSWLRPGFYWSCLTHIPKVRLVLRETAKFFCRCISNLTHPIGAAVAVDCEWLPVGRFVTSGDDTHHALPKAGTLSTHVD